MKVQLNKRILLLYSSFGSILFLTSGIFIIRSWESSPRDTTRDYAMIKGVISIMNSIVFFMDTIFTFRQKKWQGPDQEAGSAKPSAPSTSFFGKFAGAKKPPMGKLAGATKNLVVDETKSMAVDESKAFVVGGAKGLLTDAANTLIEDAGSEASA